MENQSRKDHQSRRAEDIAYSFSGVSEVYNKLMLRESGEREAKEGEGVDSDQRDMKEETGRTRRVGDTAQSEEIQGEGE
jgi:osmotically-inducible protein OsmY